MLRSVAQATVLLSFRSPVVRHVGSQWMPRCAFMSTDSKDEAPVARPSTEAGQTTSTSWRAWADQQLSEQKPETAASVAPAPTEEPQRDKEAGPSTVPSKQEVVDILSASSKQSKPHETAFASYGLLAQATDAPRSVFGSRAAEQSPARVSPFRLFFPGQTYSPEDLDPYKATSPEVGRPVRPTAAIPAPVVRARADFRDVGFLGSFVTDTGRLLPRRRTRLSAKLHKHVARQVKTARAMGLLRADAAPARQRRST